MRTTGGGGGEWLIVIVGEVTTTIGVPVNPGTAPCTRVVSVAATRPEVIADSLIGVSCADGGAGQIGLKILE